MQRRQSDQINISKNRLKLYQKLLPFIDICPISVHCLVDNNKTVKHLKDDIKWKNKCFAKLRSGLGEPLRKLTWKQFCMLTLVGGWLDYVETRLINQFILSNYSKTAILPADNSASQLSVSLGFGWAWQTRLYIHDTIFY